MWNKWIIDRIYWKIHMLNWIRLAHHRWNENITNSTTWILSYPHIYHKINKTSSRLTNLACNRWKKYGMTGFIYFSNNDSKNIPNLSNPTVNSSLASQKKCDNMFSDPEADHIYSHLLGMDLVYILFLIAFGKSSTYYEEGSV